MIKELLYKFKILKVSSNKIDTWVNTNNQRLLKIAFDISLLDTRRYIINSCSSHQLLEPILVIALEDDIREIFDLAKNLLLKREISNSISEKINERCLYWEQEKRNHQKRTLLSKTRKSTEYKIERSSRIADQFETQKRHNDIPGTGF